MSGQLKSDNPYFALDMLCKAGSADQVCTGSDAIGFHSPFVYFDIDPRLQATSLSLEPK